MAAYPAGFLTHVTCRLTVMNRDQLRNPTLGNKYGLPTYIHFHAATCSRTLISEQRVFSLFLTLSNSPLFLSKHSWNTRNALSQRYFNELYYCSVTLKYQSTFVTLMDIRRYYSYYYCCYSHRMTY